VKKLKSKEKENKLPFIYFDGISDLNILVQNFLNKHMKIFI